MCQVYISVWIGILPIHVGEVKITQKDNIGKGDPKWFR